MWTTVFLRGLAVYLGPTTDSPSELPQKMDLKLGGGLTSERRDCKPDTPGCYSSLA